MTISSYHYFPNLEKLRKVCVKKGEGGTANLKVFKTSANILLILCNKYFVSSSFPIKLVLDEIPCSVGLVTWPATTMARPPSSTMLQQCDYRWVLYGRWRSLLNSQAGGRKELRPVVHTCRGRPFIL